MPTSDISTQHHCYHQHPSLPTNTTHPPPLTPTAITHHSQPPLMPPTTSICHCTTHHGGWRLWGASVVGGGDEWRQLKMHGRLQVEENGSSKWAKKTQKQHVFLFFFPHLGGGFQKQVWNFPLFFNPSLCHNALSYISMPTKGPSLYIQYIQNKTNKGGVLKIQKLKRFFFLI